MSRSSAPAKSRPQRQAASSAKPKLTLIDPKELRRARRRRFLTSIGMFIVGIALFAVALVHAELVRSQRNLDATNQAIIDAENRVAELERHVMVASSPGEIVQRAEAMGMVRAVSPVYLVADRPATPSSVTASEASEDTASEEVATEVGEGEGQRGE